MTQSVGLMGLCEIQLPSGNVFLCDGGFMEFGGQTYRATDQLLGMIGSIAAMGEGTGSEIPALQMVLLPPQDVSPGDLVQPGWQRSRARFWIGEFSPDTGTLLSAPDLVFDGQLDQTTLSAGAGRSLSVTVVSLAERLFERNTGNSLTSAWHKSIWPGELGHDNATGLAVQVAWGTASPPSSGASTPTGQYRVPAKFDYKAVPA